MADVSRSVYLSRKHSNVNDDSTKHIYDGIFSTPPATKLNGVNFSSPIDDYREIFPPSKASLGSSIPVLDLPAVDRNVGAGRALSSGFDYAGVFGGFGDNDGIGVLPEQLIRDSKKTAKRDAQLPRSPVPTRRMPSKSQEFSRNYANNQTSGPVQTRRMPSKSQEFSCNNGNDQTSSTAHVRRMPAASQEFSGNYGNDQLSNLADTRRMPSKSQEFPVSYGNDQIASSAQTRRMPSKSQEFPCNYGDDQTASTAQTTRVEAAGQEFSRNYGNDQTPSAAETRIIPPSKIQDLSYNHGNDQTSSPVQTRRMPSKSQEFSCNYGNDQTSRPTETRRMPSKSQEFSCNYANDQTLSPAQTRMQYSKSQEFPVNVSNSNMSTSPVPTSKPASRVDELSANSPNYQTSASPLPHQTVDSVKQVSVSYHKTNQFSKDGTNGMTHIAHLHAVPGYTLLFDEAGPVKKTGFDKAKRLSMNDADFSDAVGKVSRQGKHTRTVSDLGTNKQASDLDPGFQEGVKSHDNREVSSKPQTRSTSVSNSPQSFRGSDYFKRSSSRRPNGSTNDQEKNASGYSFPLLDEELDVNSAAAVSAAAVKSAIEDAEDRIRWAKEFLKGLEANGFIKPTLKDSFKIIVTSDTYHSYETYRPKQTVSVKVTATRKKKRVNEEKVLKQNGYFNSKASGDHGDANGAGEIKPKVDLDIASQTELENEAGGLKQKLHGTAGGVDTAMGSPAAENFEDKNAHDELKSSENSCKHEGGGEWEATKQLSQLFTGVKNRFVSFLSKQAETVIPKEAPSKCESEERGYEVRNVNTDQERGADQEHIEEKVEMNHSTSSVVGEKSAQGYTKSSLDMKVCEENENELNRRGATSSPDIEMLTSKHHRPSEPEEELEYVEAQGSANSTIDLNLDVSSEAKGELLEEVREQSREIFDGTVKIEFANQMGAIGLEERVEMPDKACQSQAFDDKVTKGEDEEIVNEVRDLEPIKKRVAKSLNNEGAAKGEFESCNFEEIKLPKGAQTKQEEAIRMVEETCMVEEFYDRLVGADEINGEAEDTERITGENGTSDATEGLTEVVDDDSEHNKHLSAANDPSKQDELFLNKNEEATVPDNASQYAEGVKFSAEGQNGTSEATEGLTEVIDDDSEHNGHAANDTSEQDELFLSKDEEATVPDDTKQYAEGVKFFAEEMGRVTESATVTFEPEEDIEQSKSVQRTKEFIEEGICKQTPCSSEVVSDGSEHDVFLPATDDILDQDELLSSSRIEEASVHDNVRQYALDVDLPLQKERPTVETYINFEPEENIEKSRTVLMGTELNGEYRSEDSGSHSGAADESLEHDDYHHVADDVCEKGEHSYVNRNDEACDWNENQYGSEDSGSCSGTADESLKHDDYLPAADDLCEKNDLSSLNRNAGACDQDENQYAQEGKVTVEEERMTTGGGISEFDCTEQPSSRQTANLLAGDRLDSDETEKEIEEAHEDSPCTDVEMGRLDSDEPEKEIEEAHEDGPCTDVDMTERDIVLKFDEKHFDEVIKSFTTIIDTENQDDESESEVRKREADEVNEQDVSSHGGESSHKRRRWFVDPGIFQVNERTLETDQDNAKSFEVDERVGMPVNDSVNESGAGVHMDQTDAGSNQDQEGEGLHSTVVDDIVEICVNDSVNESGVGVHIEQTDAGSNQDLAGEGLHSTESSHRRRRWFENSGEKVQIKPIHFTGVGVAAEMDHEIAQESNLDVSSNSDVEKFANERKDVADGTESSYVANDQVESRASTEAGHRRRRWFENGLKFGAAQKPGPAILEENKLTASLEEDIEICGNAEKHELRETSTSEDLVNTRQTEGQIKEREKEKERQAVERAIREARQRAFDDVRDRAAMEARLKAAAAAQDKPEKAKPLSDKASIDAKLRVERAAVERATAEARERALQKAMSEKGAYKSKEKDPKNPNSGPSSSGFSNAVPYTTERPIGVTTESPQRRKAISERNKRTMERAAKALEEKNMRDVLVQKEQAERNRFANSLDADVKRWSSGKEGNLRSLLSTLQYILGPDSGWQAIPLTDLVTTTAVRKAYKRAALCVHPDKLQQRRATIQQKYICEKVFDLLKDAWNKFNPDDR